MINKLVIALVVLVLSMPTFAKGGTARGGSSAKSFKSAKVGKPTPVIVPSSQDKDSKHK
jgi:hypothetical protein